MNKLSNIYDEKDDTIPHYSVLLSNPQTLGDLSSFFQPYNMPQLPPQQRIPANTIPPPTPMPGVARPIPIQPLLMQQHQIPSQAFVPISMQQSPPQQQMISPQQQEEQPPPPTESPKKRKSGLNMGVLKEKEFTRMSFNSRLNPPKRGSLASSSNAPNTSAATAEMIETIPEEPRDGIFLFF